MSQNEEEKIETTHGEHESSHKRKAKSKHWVIAGIVGLLVLVIAGGLAWLYTGQTSQTKEKVFKVLPLPAAIVDMKFVSAKEALERVNLAKQLADAQGMADQVDAGAIYKQLIEAKKLSAIVSQKNVVISPDEVNEEFKNIVKEYAGGDEEAFKKQLQDTYQISVDKFKDDVIRQELEQAKLSLWYSQQEELNKDTYAKAKELQDKINGGQSFEDVTKAYTQDEATKDFAGDSGLIPFTELLPEFRDALKDSSANDIKLIPSRYGLHLIKVLEQNSDGENGAKQIHLQQLFIKQVGFSEWLSDQIANIRVVELLKF